MTKHIPQGRIRLLPPEYSYPLHMHADTPLERQSRSLEELVCPVYEDGFEYQKTLHGLWVGEESEAWLNGHAPGGEGSWW